MRVLYVPKKGCSGRYRASGPLPADVGDGSKDDKQKGDAAPDHGKFETTPTSSVDPSSGERDRESKDASSPSGAGKDDVKELKAQVAHIGDEVADIKAMLHELLDRDYSFVMGPPRQG